VREEKDREMLRLKACEHIAEGEAGWGRLEHKCPSTMAVATLRRRFEAAESELKQSQGELIEAKAQNLRIKDGLPAGAKRYEVFRKRFLSTADDNGQSEWDFNEWLNCQLFDQDEVIKQEKSLRVKAEELADDLAGALKMCASSAGIPDPREACRVIIRRVKEAIKLYNESLKERKGD